MHALKYGYLSVLSGVTANAVCTGSELSSPSMRSKYFQPEAERLRELEGTPIIAFEKDFLRWMLSDGAGAALLEDHPSSDLNLRVDWIDGLSYANALDTCMYAGGEKLSSGRLKPWREYEAEEWLGHSIFSLKQDVRLLGENVIKCGGWGLKEVARKRSLSADSIDFLLPHISSEAFRNKVEDGMRDIGFHIPQERWFTNLSEVGNVGSASVYLMLEELFRSGGRQSRLNHGGEIATRR